MKPPIELLLFALAKSQSKKGESTSDDEGDPAYRLRHRPVSDDDGPLLKNPHQMEQRHHCEDHPGANGGAGPHPQLRRVHAVTPPARALRRGFDSEKCEPSNDRYSREACSSDAVRAMIL